MRNINKQATLPARFTPLFWDDADGRTAVIKEIRHRYFELTEAVCADSFQKELLCQRVVFIAIQLETVERIAAEGGAFDSGKYTQMVNTLIGLLKSLGLERAKKVVSLSKYIENQE